MFLLNYFAKYKDNKLMKFALFQLPFIVLLGFFCTGCSLTYNLNQPVPPTVTYDLAVKKNEIIMNIIDNRVDTKFTKGITGLQSLDIKIGNVNDPIAWLAESLNNEFRNRGISIKINNKDDNVASPDIVLTINKYQIVSSRTSGFHPYVAYHSFSGKLQNNELNSMVIAYFLYGKTPIWSMGEIQAPCFDMPMSILVKEIAAKINRISLHYSLSDQQLENLNIQVEEKIKMAAPDAYLSVLDLGASNNPKAMDYLVRLADADDTLIRACALSAIGMLGADGKLDFLKGKYAQYVDIDRFMALKSIGDIGTPEAIDFIKNARQDPQYDNDNGFKFCVDLYLEASQ
ncbi:MAG: hypothetical protein A2521_09865 [Deltaproteobacteria bacterium RIFOXYD12_FULL_57_12]|nr:MAG: hypothetical protein A2521_09865 [Deltaproteobacteria bacterium RIFOXYD12_FULL_57_12]